jgi:hypothetical protein
MEVSSSHISILPTEVFEHSTEVKTNPSSSGGGGVSQAGAQRGVLHVSRREAARRASRRKAGAALCASACEATREHEQAGRGSVSRLGARAGAA